LLLGFVSKPISDQIFTPGFFSQWREGKQTITSLAPPTPWILAGLAFAWIGMFLLNEYWLEPRLRHADLVNGALGHLYREWFGHNSGHRISFLAKRRLGFHLRVFFRFSHGNSTHFQSRAHFPIGKAVAGMAWKYPSRFWALQIPATVHGPQPFRDFMRTEYKLSPRQTNLLSDETTEVRWIICYGIVDPRAEFCGVLCVDSIQANSLQQVKPETLTACANLLGAILLAHDKARTD